MATKSSSRLLVPIQEGSTIPPGKPQPSEGDTTAAAAGYFRVSATFAFQGSCTSVNPILAQVQ